MTVLADEATSTGLSASTPATQSMDVLAEPLPDFILPCVDDNERRGCYSPRLKFRGVDPLPEVGPAALSTFEDAKYNQYCLSSESTFKWDPTYMTPSCAYSSSVAVPPGTGPPGDDFCPTSINQAKVCRKIDGFEFRCKLELQLSAEFTQAEKTWMENNGFLQQLDMLDTESVANCQARPPIPAQVVPPTYCGRITVKQTASSCFNT
jgi:hypothetical protein